MENITNKVMELNNGKKYFIIRQALYKDVTYYFATLLTDDEEDFTGDFIFLERYETDGKAHVREVTDNKIIEVLAKNIKVDE